MTRPYKRRKPAETSETSSPAPTVSSEAIAADAPPIESIDRAPELAEKESRLERLRERRPVVEGRIEALKEIIHGGRDRIEDAMLAEELGGPQGTADEARAKDAQAREELEDAVAREKLIERTIEELKGQIKILRQQLHRPRFKAEHLKIVSASILMLENLIDLNEQEGKLFKKLTEDGGANGSARSGEKLRKFPTTLLGGGLEGKPVVANRHAIAMLRADFVRAGYDLYVPSDEEQPSAVQIGHLFRPMKGNPVTVE